MTRKSDFAYVEDMLESAQLIVNWFPNSEGIDNLSETSKDYHALIRCLQIVGEVSKRITQSTKDRFPDVDWKSISGTRDILVHDYDEIDYEIIKRIVGKEIPKLITQLKEMRSLLEDDYYREVAR